MLSARQYRSYAELEVCREEWVLLKPKDVDSRAVFLIYGLEL